MARQEGSLQKEKFPVDETVTGSAKLEFVHGVPYGNVNAGIDLAVTISDGKIKLAGANEAVLGRLESIEQDGLCSVVVSGDRVYFASTGTITTGTGIIGAVSNSKPGYVTSPDISSSDNVVDNINTAIANASKGRGIIVEKDIPGDPDVVRVVLP